MVPIERVLLIALGQKGDRYIFGAEASALDPNPDAFDCCIVEGVMVTTDRGAAPVEAVQPGDKVACWEAGALAWRKVEAVATQPVQSSYKVRTRSRALLASANHPVLRLARSERKRVGVPVEWSTEWARVDELARGDLIVTLDDYDISDGEPCALEDGTRVTDEVAWLAGVVLGDGTMATGGGLSVCVYGSRAARVADVIERTWACNTSHHQQHGVMAHPKRVGAAFASMPLSPQRTIPGWVWTAPANLIRSFLDGYSTDAHRDKRGHLTYASASRQLTEEVRALHQMLGDRTSNVTTNPRRKPVTIKGKLVQNPLPLHSVTVYPDATSRNQTMLDTYGARRALPDRRFGAERVLAVEPIGEQPTYDLQIEGAHNYVADGIVVHNSELVEWSCRRAAVDPTVPDGSSAQHEWCRSRGRLISADEGVRTRGALLFHPGHVAWSLGNGTTIEARGRKWGVGVFPSVHRFTEAGILPGIDYKPRPQVPPAPHGIGPGAAAASVSFLEAMLTIVRKQAGKAVTIRIDGKYDDQTKAAVAEFQRDFNASFHPSPLLAVTGGADPATLNAIGLVIHIIFEG